MCCGTQGQIQFGILKLVGAPGFEPGTSASRTRRATRLRYAPTIYKNLCYIINLSVPNAAR